MFRAWGCAYVAGRPWAEGAGSCDGFFATSAAQLPQVGQPGGPQRGVAACEAANCAPLVKPELKCRAEAKTR